MKQNKLILFDWGNIVESHTTGYSCKKAWYDLFKACGYNGTDDIHSMLGKYRLSAIKKQEEFEKVYYLMKEDFKLNTSFNEFIKNYYNYFDKIESYQEVRKYEVSLKDKCYIGILSNLTIYDKERIDRQLRLKDYDYVFLSFELGYRKPDIEIYEEVQKRLPFNKEDILFIDDRLDNIESAKEFGWNTFQATGLELDKIKEACNKFLNNY